MDNEAPNYASWIPEAGGYVANGKVVSRTPQYDANGRLVNIDANLFNQAKPSTTQAQPQVANTLQGNAGVATANILGSGTDANSMATNIGSNGSLNLNTANPDESAISTPATKSPVAGKTIVTPEDKANQDYLDAAGRNDYQGMINALVEKGNYDGQDYSTQIENLTKQREQKIMNIDDQYLAQYNDAQRRYNNAKLSGDEQGMLQAQADMNAIAAEQAKWRNAVGYQGAMQTAQQREERELQIDYEYTYMDGINQIAQSAIQLVGNYLNFQYDPYKDSALQIAQGYATSRVKEQMNSTGMFYSTMTQNAITKAVAELVPVYEKMAKEEMLQQINLLQSTASFLMDLEQAQFNMWKGQIQLQWDANAEKRAQVKAAIDSANARGYYTNEEAALVGVEPGSMSQAAREHETSLLEEIDRENRSLQQQMVLADYKNALETQTYAIKQSIAAKYTRTSGGDGPNSGDSSSPTKFDGLTVAQWKTYAKDYVKKGGDIADVEEMLAESEFTEAQKNYILNVSDDSEQTPADDTSLKTDDGAWDDLKVKRHIYDDIKELDVEGQVNELTDLVYDYVYSKIDEYSPEFDNSSNTKANNAVNSAFSSIEKFANWVEDTDLSADQKALLIQIGTDRLMARIDQTDKIPETQTEMKRALVSKMDNSGNTTIKHAVANNYSQYRKSNVKTVTPKTTSTEKPDNNGRVYVNEKIPESSYPSVADKKEYAKRKGYVYDEEKGKMYYTVNNQSK